MSLLLKSICLLGAYKTCVPLFNFGLHHYNNDYRSQYESIEERFRKYYGSTPDTPAEKKGWALITGGSDGIGKEYALLLAKSGFNIAVTGRSESKLASFKKELEDQGAAMVKTFSFDVSKCKDYSAITEDADLKSNLRVIINSVGMITSSHTFDSKPQDIQNMLIANHYPVTLLSKFAKNSFIKQEKLSNELHKRYAMIQLSSMSGVRYKVNIGVYSGTKNYILKLNDMINVLNKDSANLKTLSIDSQCVCPGLVTTPMANYATKKYKTCMPVDTARGSLNDLGTLDRSYGSHVHSAWGCQVMCTPDWVRNYVQRQHLGLDKNAKQPFAAL